MEVQKFYFNDKAINNNPLQVFALSMGSLGKVYERQVYTFNDMLGNVGGINGIL